jgi:hypothetical protein
MHQIPHQSEDVHSRFDAQVVTLGSVEVLWYARSLARSDTPSFAPPIRLAAAMPFAAAFLCSPLLSLAVSLPFTAFPPSLFYLCKNRKSLDAKKM